MNKQQLEKIIHEVEQSHNAKREMLTLSDIQILTDQHVTALDDELQAVENLAYAESNLESIETALTASAFENGTIDGKNTETRKAQIAAFLADNKTHNDAVNAVKKSKHKLGIETNTRKAIETKISLVRAWLYAQSGTNK